MFFFPSRLTPFRPHNRPAVLTLPYESVPPRFEQLEHLLGAIFSKVEGAPLLNVGPAYATTLAEAVGAMLATLSHTESQIIKLRFGLNRAGKQYTPEELAAELGLSVSGVIKLEARALKRLREPERARIVSNYLHAQDGRQEPPPAPALADLAPVIETVRKLTPALIEHLKRREDDLSKIHWKVFEHLIAEFFASWGFHDVRLVGRNAMTSADIYAAAVLNPVGIEQRFFIEVKRWKDKVGIDIINQVLGAFIGERDRYGWHAAVIVTVVGFTDFQKWSREELRLKGVALKDKEDLLCWLRNYKQRTDGLWLPEPSASL